MRETYVPGVQKLSLQDVYNQKDVPWPEFETIDIDAEFRPLGDDIATELVDRHGYSNESAKTLEKEVLYLLNHPTAIQRKASLQTEGVVQFEVASTGAKNGTVQVSVYRDHATCVCGRYLRHLNFVRSKSGQVHKRTALAEHDVQKATAGKKGGRNKYGYRPARGKAQPSSSASAQTGPLYSEIHHNENPFELVFLVESVKRCKSCHLNFCHRKKVIPFDVIFSHKERWMYPVNGDWSNCRPPQQETVRYYHASMKCLLTRFPYFTADYISTPSDVKESLQDSHKSYLANKFGLTFD